MNATEGTQWLTTPCECARMPVNRSLHYHPFCERGRTGFKSGPDMWNVYTVGMLNLARSKWRRPASLVLIRYEDLILRPEDTLDKLSKALKIPMDKNVNKG